MALAAPLAASPLAAQQRVLLQVRPRTGDTIRMKLDQQVEMSGTARVGGVDSTMTVTTAMQVHTRCVVQGSDAAGTTVLATTDSVRIMSDGERPAEIDQARRAIQGRRVRLRLAPDGAAAVVDDGEGQQSPELRAVFAQMPATLPPRPVAAGETWTRTMDIPGAGAAGGAGGGTLTATFRLDSLSRGGDVAWVSMRGALARPPAAPGAVGDAAGARVNMTGTVAGTMTIDRRRGWMTDARTTLTVRSVVAPLAPDHGEPMRVRMKMTQWLRTY
ncbi:MAG: DUF6263 family protein [Gemmatimonadaceae bacterium]